MTGEDIAFAYESVATAYTAKEMARAGLRRRLRQGRVRRGLAVVWILATALLYLSADWRDDTNVASRLASSALFAGAIVLVVTAALIPVGYFVTRRNFAATVRPGNVARSGFGADEFVTSNELSSSRTSYRAVRSIDVYDRFVFIRMVGSPLDRVYPRELFPPEELERFGQVADQG